MNEEDKKLYATIGDNINLLRKLNHETQSNLAKILNISQSKIIRMEAGKVKLSSDELKKISDHYRVSMDEVMTVNYRERFWEKLKNYQRESNELFRKYFG